ncbi:hypothetical protein PsAD37_03724 [Pseudovibrio sp. Ad37]|nr:hypothetical protein PsAD37_03724 [Pseudovibrio sp. Ad37]
MSAGCLVRADSPHMPFEGTDPFASASTLSIGVVPEFDKQGLR